jgi:hypothetical protein
VQIETLLQSLFVQSPAAALALLIWYYSNRDLLRFMQERREMIDALHQITSKYDAMQQQATEARVITNAEMHALRGKIQELIHKVEILLMRVEKQAGASGN